MADTEPLYDPHPILAAAAALADHLHRSGVTFLPRVRTESAERLRSWFAVEEEAAAEPSAASAAPPAKSIAKPTPTPTPPTPPPSRPVPIRRTDTVPAFTAAEGAYAGPSLSPADRQAFLKTLAADVSACTKCPVLSSCRTKTVFGEGSVSPRFVFVGEAPGADEDRSGRPFVGRAGELLTKMIEACKLRRDDNYVMNTVKCRPPGNRNPEPDEIANCTSYLEQQLVTLRPEYIVCLGAIAAQTLLKSKLPVGRLRGKLHQYHNSKVVVTYHPAYLLRTPAAKQAAWDDLQMMMRDAGLL